MSGFFKTIHSTRRALLSKEYGLKTVHVEFLNLQACLRSFAWGRLIVSTMMFRQCSIENKHFFIFAFSDHVCKPNPCLHSGVCKVGKKGETWRFQCSCPKQFTGSKCEGNPCSIFLLFLSIPGWNNLVTLSSEEEKAPFISKSLYTHAIFLGISWNS